MGDLQSHMELLPADECLPHNNDVVSVSPTHAALGTPTLEPFPLSMQMVIFGLGCFWGAERKFWQIKGVHSTQVGYAGGVTRNPTYHEVCSGQTNHAEVVRVVYEEDKVPLENLLKVFWEIHDPTQAMRQGNDVGTQYRSAIYTYKQEQFELAAKSRDAYQAELSRRGFDEIATEIKMADQAPFYYAEDDHQQYLDKNPGGYCNLRGTGVKCVE